MAVPTHGHSRFPFGVVMKFWLTLIVGTIAISAGLTFLNLYKGAQTLS
jgi:hypothetical protein